MTTRITNTSLFRTLINSLGPKGKAFVEFKLNISRSTIDSILKGRVPSEVMQKKLAAFFDVDVKELFPLINLEQKSA